MGRKVDVLRDARSVIAQLSELIGDDGLCEFCESIHEASDVTGCGLDKYRTRSKPLPTRVANTHAVIAYDKDESFVLAISTDFEMLPLNVQTTTGTRVYSIMTVLPITNCPMCGARLRR